MPQRKKIALRPNRNKGKIKHVHVGPIWTEITIVLRTNRLFVQAGRQSKK